jgi:hypothetical protein
MYLYYQSDFDFKIGQHGSCPLHQEVLHSVIHYKGGIVLGIDTKDPNKLS